MTRTDAGVLIDAICGECGGNVADPKTSLCINNHDFWVELSDMGNRQHAEYVATAADNLGVSITGLWERVIVASSTYNQARSEEGSRHG